MSSAFGERVFYAQHFLKDARLVARLVQRCELGAEDVVYEIGPGRGIITEELARRCKRVVAIEKDARLAARLRERFEDRPQVRIESGDFLECRLPCGRYKVFANIPFNITAAIVTRLTGAEHAPVDACLAMQAEAGAMLLGEPRESLRTILLKPWFEVELVHRFHRWDFTPAPQVDVVMLRLRKRGPPLVSERLRGRFRDFAVFAFTGRQPTLDAALRGVLTGPQVKHIRRAVGFDDLATPTRLTLEQWLELFERFNATADERALRTIARSERRLIEQQGRLQKGHRFSGLIRG